MLLLRESVTKLDVYFDSADVLNRHCDLLVRFDWAKSEASTDETVVVGPRM